eukprot:12939102-Alexandrium_andersonii.AAC.1
MAHGVIFVHKHSGLRVACHGGQPRAHSPPLGWVLRHVEARGPCGRPATLVPCVAVALDALAKATAEE